MSANRQYESVAQAARGWPAYRAAARMARQTPVDSVDPRDYQHMVSVGRLGVLVVPDYDALLLDLAYADEDDEARVEPALTIDWNPDGSITLVHDVPANIEDWPIGTADFDAGVLNASGEDDDEQTIALQSFMREMNMGSWLTRMNRYRFPARVVGGVPA